MIQNICNFITYNEDNFDFWRVYYKKSSWWNSNTFVEFVKVIHYSKYLTKISVFFVIRISALPGIEVPLVHIRSDGSVTRKTSTLDDIMRNLTWIDEKGKKQKMPLRDLRCFIPSHGLNKKSIESPLQSIHASPFHKEIGLPAIMPRAKAS